MHHHSRFPRVTPDHPRRSHRALGVARRTIKPRTVALATAVALAMAVVLAGMFPDLAWSSTESPTAAVCGMEDTDASSARETLRDMTASAGAFDPMSARKRSRQVEAVGRMNTPPELPGWPQSTAGEVLVTPRVGDIDGNGDQEIVACDNQGYVYAWNDDGTPFPGWPISVQVMVTTPAALGDLDNDGDLEIVLSTANSNQVYAWHHDGTPVSGWPVVAGGGAGSFSCAVTIEDLDGDGYLDVIVGSISAHVYAWDRFGADLPGWPQPTDDLVWCRAPAVADLDDDGDLEVIVGDMSAKVYVWHHDGVPATGWPILTGGGTGGVRPAPVLADIDGDTDLEVFACSWADRRANAWHHDGTIVAGWPVTVPGSNGMVATPAIGTLDGSPGLEIAVATYSGSYVTALHADGSVVSGWPIYMGGYTINSSFAMADIDGDGDREVLVGSQDNSLYAWHHDGSLVDDFPLPTGDAIVSSPTVADVDQDGDVELVIGSGDHSVHIWDLESPHLEADIDWGTQFHDNRHTDLYVPPGPSSVDLGPGHDPIAGSALTCRLAPNPFHDQTTIYCMAPMGADLANVRAVLYGADGRLIRVLPGRASRSPRGVSSYDGAGGGHLQVVSALVWDGRDQAGKRVPAGTYFVRTRTAGSSYDRIADGPPVGSRSQVIRLR